jgi:hypothetical protein
VRRGLVLLAAVLALALASSGASARAASFSANGSAEQVYVTGLPGSARASLLNARGRRVQTGRADSLGGLLFRGVKPGSGYSVRLLPHGPASGPVTVHSDAAAPWGRPGIPATPRDSFTCQPSPMAPSELARGRTCGRIASAASGAGSRAGQPSAKRTRSAAVVHKPRAAGTVPTSAGAETKAPGRRFA